MDITTFMGIPAHPLMVHVPVVLVPLSTIGAILMIWPRWRSRFGWPTVALSFVALVFTQLAIDSGESLEDSVQRSELLRDHTSIAENARPWVLVLFLAVLAVMLIGLWIDRRPDASAPANPPAVLIAAILTVLIGIGASATIYQVGHSGAKATWSKVKIRSEREEHDDDDD